MENSDARLTALWELALSGSETAYHELLTALASLLRRYVQAQLVRLGRSHAETEDIVQEALLAIHAKRHAYDRNIPIKVWAYAITRYKMIDFLRVSRNAVQTLPLADVEDVIGTDAAQIENRLTIGRVLDTLPERMRRPIELMKLEGKSVKETAAMTGASEAAVRVNIHRGLKLMARALR
jgi:RNA polymerase sigma-70 factor (ECF subfamily)